MGKGLVFTLAFCILCLCTKAQAQAQEKIWQINQSESQLKFTVDAEGLSFTGGFKQVIGTLALNPDSLNSASIDLKIPINEIHMGNTEADTLALSALFFDAQRWPYARFLSHSFTQIDKNKIQVTGTLTIRDQSQVIAMPITLSIENQTVYLRGETELMRLTFQVGTGEWEDTQRLTNAVKVSINLSLSPIDPPE